jgi:hypothetical protein
MVLVLDAENYFSYTMAVSFIGLGNLFFLVRIQTRAHKSYDCNIISLILYINMHSCELDSSPLEGVLDKTLCREVCQKVHGFLMVLVS